MNITNEQIAIDLSQYTPAELKDYARRILEVKCKSDAQRNGLIVAKKLYKEKTGIPLSTTEIIS